MNDVVREWIAKGLRRGDIEAAARFGRVYELKLLAG